MSKNPLTVYTLGGYTLGGHSGLTTNFESKNPLTVYTLGGYTPGDHSGRTLWENNQF